MTTKSFFYSLIKPSPNKARYYIGILTFEDFYHKDHVDRYKHIRWVKSEMLEDQWIADPFILRVTDKTIYILAEQMFHGKGRLVLLEVSLITMEILRLKVILDLETHLSFPYVWREKDCIYVIPENVSNGNLRMWKYNQVQERLEEPIILIDEPLEDAQICKIGDKYFIMGVKYVHNDYFLCTRHLQIYKADSLLGPYTHIQTIDNKSRLERGAGTIWHDGDTLVRPAQNCEDGYGTNLLFYRMKYENGLFAESLEYEFYPDMSHPRSRVFHTYNEKDGYVVVDGNAFVNPRWSKFFFTFKKKIGL